MDGINREPNNKRRKWSVDELNDRLYHKDERFDQKTRRKIHSRKYNLKNDWEDTPAPGQKGFKLPPSLWKKFFWFGLVLFFAAMITAGIAFLIKQERVSDDLIRMEIVSQSFIDGGDTLTLQVDIQNFNVQPLESAELTIKYPKDSELEDAGFVYITRELEDISERELITESFDVILFGREGEERHIEALLEYRINDSSSVFQKQVQHKTLIRSTPTILTVEAPENIVKNQEVTFTYSLAANSNTTIENALLTVDFPRDFNVLSVNPRPSFGNNAWLFPTLSTRDTQVSITGVMSAFEGEGQSLHARLGRQNEETLVDIETVFNSLVHTVWVDKPFVDVRLAVNGENDETVIIRGGASIGGSVSYKNTLDEALDNVRLILNLEGSLYDASDVKPQSGFFDSNQQSIIWDSTTAPELASLAPGQSGSFSFTMATLDLVQGSGAIIDPNYLFSLDIFGAERNGEVREALGVDTAKVIANSDLRLIAKSSHYGENSNNTGPMPPKVGRPTTYTVQLHLTNSANNIQDARVRTQFPSYVRYMGGIIPSGESDNISYNDTSRELIWDIGDIVSGMGVGNSSPKELSFQVEVTPSLSQVGRDPALTTQISASGFDVFTEETLITNHRPITTRLKDERSEEGSDGKVIE